MGGGAVDTAAGRERAARHRALVTGPGGSPWTPPRWVPAAGDRYDPAVMDGPLYRFFADDHRRLDALIRRAGADPPRVDLVAFDAFRAGILKHIAMEEKRLIPAFLSATGAGFPLAAKLRVDHGAIAALLVPTPRPDVIGLLQSLLGSHNPREEGPGGLYEACEDALGAAASADLVAALRSFPDVRLKPYNDGPAVERHIRETLDLSRRQWA